MASQNLGLLIISIILFSCTASCYCYSSTVISGGQEPRGRKVGGRTDVQDVKHNNEIQDLGKFSVAEENRIHKKELVKGGGLLTFSEVVEAQKQVVSGYKYYLKIDAVQKGVAKTYDAVVVVQPWMRASPNKLLSFTHPSVPN